MAAELHHVAPRRYTRRRIIVFSVDQEWTSDLLDLQKFSAFNQGVRYVMVLQDVFSRYLWLFPLKNKQQLTILACLRSLFDKGIRCRRYFLCDRGTEFIGGAVVSFLREHGVQEIHNYGEHKASISERTCRFVAGRLYRYMTEQNDSRWLAWLPVVATGYNKTRQRRTGLSPTQARLPENTARGMAAIFKHRDIEASRRVFKPGDLVRVSHTRSVFSKGYHQSFSTQQYVVAKVVRSIPVQYLLKDLLGHELLGGFYAAELIHSHQTHFYHTVLKSRTVKGRQQHYVHWSGFPDDQDSWIWSSDLEDAPSSRSGAKNAHKRIKYTDAADPPVSSRVLRSAAKKQTPPLTS